MSLVVAIAVLVFGTVLTFVLPESSVGGVDLRMMGVILMLGGAFRLLRPLVRDRSRWSQSTVRSRQDVIDERVNDHLDGRPPPSRQS